MKTLRDRAHQEARQKTTSMPDERSPRGPKLTKNGLNFKHENATETRTPRSIADTTQNVDKSTVKATKTPVSTPAVTKSSDKSNSTVPRTSKGPPNV